MAPNRTFYVSKAAIVGYKTFVINDPLNVVVSRLKFLITAFVGHNVGWMFVKPSTSSSRAQDTS